MEQNKPEALSINRRSVFKAAGAGLALGSVPGLNSVRAAAAPRSADAVRDEEAGSPISWSGSMGTHYALDSERWLGLARSPAGAQAGIGMPPDVTDLSHEGIEPIVGHFSGENRYYDFAGITGGADYIETQKQANAQGIDVVWITMGIRRDLPDFEDRLNLLVAKRGAYFKDLVYQFVTTMHTGELAGHPGATFFELGNEVNGRFTIEDNGPVRNNLKDLADYVDFYLAPALEAIQAASQDIYGDPMRVQVVGPQIALAPDGYGSYEESLDALDFVLNRRITRDSHVSRRSGLIGRRVWRVLDRFSVHYTLGDHGLLSKLYDKWIATGRMRGFLQTEELGRRGVGAYGVALFAFRYFDFWTQRDWNEDISRVCYWGDGINRPAQGIPIDSKGVEAEDLLGSYLRDYPLSNARDQVEFKANAGFEAYALRGDTPDGERRYALYFKHNMEAVSRLNWVRVSPPENGAGQLVSVDVTKINASSVPETVEPLGVTAEDDGALITFNAQLAYGDSYVIFVRFAS